MNSLYSFEMKNNNKTNWSNWYNRTYLILFQRNTCINMIMMQTRTVKIVELHNPMYRYLEIKGGFFLMLYQLFLGLDIYLEGRCGMMVKWFQNMSLKISKYFTLKTPLIMMMYMLIYFIRLNVNNNMINFIRYRWRNLISTGLLIQTKKIDTVIHDIYDWWNNWFIIQYHQWIHWPQN